MSPAESDSSEKSSPLMEGLDARLNTLEEELKQLGNNVPAQVHKCKELAQSLGLSKRIVEIFNETRWGDPWIKNQVKQKDGEEDIVQFDYNEKSYSFRVKHSHDRTELTQWDMRTPALLQLCDSKGRVLLAVHMEKLDDNEVPFWGYFPLEHGDDIDAFIPGDWLKDFLELSSRITAQENGRKQKFEADKLEQVKKKFGLDQEK